MNELIQLLYDYLLSDDGPELYDDVGVPLSDEEALELAQQLAGHIVASGWPKES